VGSATARSPRTGDARLPSGRSRLASSIRTASRLAAEKVAAVAICVSCHVFIRYMRLTGRSATHRQQTLDCDLDIVTARSTCGHARR